MKVKAFYSTKEAAERLGLSHDHVKLTGTAICPQCQEPVVPHHVCTNCGTYRGKTVIKTEET